MKKTKKKDRGKKAGKKANALSGAAKSLKKLGKNSVGKLSTTQKVVAGATLGVLGVRYLVRKLSQPKATAAKTDYADAGASSHTLGTAPSE